MKNLEKIWTLIVGVIAFVARYIIPVRIDAGWDTVTVHIPKIVKGCKMGADFFIDGCGWFRFLNTAMIIIAIVLIGYFVYYNFEELKKQTIKFLNKIKK